MYSIRKKRDMGLGQLHKPPKFKFHIPQKYKKDGTVH